jgi:hypothetical protein
LSIGLILLELNKKKYEKDDQDEEDKGGDDGEVSRNRSLKPFLERGTQTKR